MIRSPEQRASFFFGIFSTAPLVLSLKCCPLQIRPSIGMNARTLPRIANNKYVNWYLICYLVEVIASYLPRIGIRTARVDVGYFPKSIPVDLMEWLVEWIFLYVCLILLNSQ